MGWSEFVEWISESLQKGAEKQKQEARYRLRRMTDSELRDVIDNGQEWVRVLAEEELERRGE
ncbi:hypothetical protein C4588_05755 [Candidatus Parcubacteria bacterium]|nr:MAG: hypothetical protein C4588_05755 [Candidatus Parcubacteria bacterium]